MTSKEIIELREKDKIISDLTKEIEIISSENKNLNSELKNNDLFYQLQQDLVSDEALNIKAYFKIKELDLFDYEFYISEYNHVSNIDPLLHYIYIGYKENKNPNKLFDGNCYLDNYPEIKQLGMNPLVYFVLYGQFEGKTLINENMKVRKTINKLELNDIINKFNISGVNYEKNQPRIIISLTSFPERIYDIHYCIFSLMNQKLKADKIVLWLAEEEFPNKEKDLTVELLSLKNNGLEIRWCENIYSYKKLIPSLREFPNDIIVTADDDLYYPEDWLELLYADYLKYPNCIISQRARKISLNPDGSFNKYSAWDLLDQGAEPSYLNFPTNGAGTLFPPNSFDDSIFNIPLLKDLCPTADDLWFWVMAIKNKTKIKVLNENISELTYINLAREDLILNEKVLWSTNTTGKNNDVQLKSLVNYFPEINQIIHED